jgi:magnesium and cobalt transporter
MTTKHQSTWLERIGHLFHHDPENVEEFLALIEAATEKDIIDRNTMAMIQGALNIASMQARDILIPMSQVHLINIEEPIDEVVDFIIQTGHSRFPVYGNGEDHILGILHAKDLLRLCLQERVILRDLLRPPMFIPESKRLNSLLKEFRQKRNHLALVVDEYGTMSGIVTIEDVLEQIVDHIEDEYDILIEDKIIEEKNGVFQVNGLVPIACVNQKLGTHFDEETFDTIGGLIAATFGHLPQKGESLDIGGWRVTVAETDRRRIYALRFDRLAAQ